MSYSAVRIADRFLEIARDESTDVLPSQLMHLVCSAHEQVAGRLGRRLIDEIMLDLRPASHFASLDQKIAAFGDKPVLYPLSPDSSNFVIEHSVERVIQEIWERNTF